MTQDHLRRRSRIMIGFATATAALGFLGGSAGEAPAAETHVAGNVAVAAADCVGNEYGYGCLSADRKTAFVVDRRCNDGVQAFIRVHHGGGWGTLYDRNGCRAGASRSHLTVGHYDTIGICRWSSGRPDCDWS